MNAKPAAEPIAWVEEDGVLYVAQLPQGPLFVLTGTSAAIWLEAQRAGLVGLTERLADAYGVPPDTIELDVRLCLAELRGLGVIVSPHPGESS